MPGRSTTKAIHFTVVELYKDRRKDFWMVVIDLEKAYDKVKREVLWRWLEKKDVSNAYIGVIRDMYEGRRTSVSTLGEI